MTALTWILAILIAFFFTMTGIVKIFGTPKKLFKEQKKEFFDNYGIDRRGIRSIGFAELFGAIAILFWTENMNIALAGAVGLVLITLGAIYFHLVFDKKPQPQAAIVMCLLTIGYIGTIIF
ncbi:MAG: DoxX family protein [Chloroflexota bacterium]